MITIPLTPIAFQFLFHDTISFHHVNGTLVKPQNRAQLLFSLDFLLDKGISIHIYVVLTFLISPMVTWLFFPSFSIICVVIANAFACTYSLVP